MRKDEFSISANQSMNHRAVFLNCPVCFNALEHEPKCLPCGHVFCLGCLVELFSKPSAGDRSVVFGGLRCPLCRRVSFLCPRSLPTVFAVASLATTNPGAALLLPHDTIRPDDEPLLLSLRDIAQSSYRNLVLLPLVQVVLEHATREAAQGRSHVRLDPELSKRVCEHWLETREYLMKCAGARDVCLDENESVLVVFFTEPFFRTKLSFRRVVSWKRVVSSLAVFIGSALYSRALYFSVLTVRQWGTHQP